MYEPVFQTTSGNIFKYRYRITVVFMVDLSNYELVVTGTKQQTGFWFQLTQKSHEFPQNHHEYAILISTYFNLSCFSEVLFQMITEKKQVMSPFFNEPHEADFQSMSGSRWSRFCRFLKWGCPKSSLVGGLEHFLFSIMYGIILPID